MLKLPVYIKYPDQLMHLLRVVIHPLLDLQIYFILQKLEPFPTKIIVFFYKIK